MQFERKSYCTTAMEVQEDTEASRVLQSNHWMLCSVLEVEQILPGALVKGLLTEEEGDEVESKLSEQGSSAGMGKILELLLQKRQSNSFDLLLEVLEENEDLRPWASYLRSDYELEVQHGRVTSEIEGHPDTAYLMNSSNEDLEKSRQDPPVERLLQLPNLRLLADFQKMQDCSMETVKRLLQMYDGLCTCSNVKDAAEKSLLHIACEVMDFRVVRMMVDEFSFDPNSQDAEGSTPLHIACQAQKAQTVIYLLNLPACDPNIRNRLGMTALHSASQKDCHVVTQFLLNSNRVDESIKEEVRNCPASADVNDPGANRNQSNGNLRTESKVAEIDGETRACCKHNIEKTGEFKVELRKLRPDHIALSPLNPLFEGLDHDAHDTSTIGLIGKNKSNSKGKNEEVDCHVCSRSCLCCCRRKRKTVYKTTPKMYQSPFLSIRLLEMVKNTFIPLLGILLGLAIIAALAYYLFQPK